MDAGLRTPLLDLFRRGDVAREVRLLAAQGAIAPRPLEQLGLLIHLCADPDLDIRTTAEATLQKIPHTLLGAFLARSEVPAEIRDFFVCRGVEVAATPAAEQEAPLVDSDHALDGHEKDVDEDKASLVEQLASMSVPEKVKAAMKGTREMRAVLIRDPNKLVALSVLSCPKVTETEVEAFARMGSVAEDVLRTIGQTRAWVKSYNIALALTRNAKTPVAMSLSLLNRLNEGDVRRISIDRNVSEPVRIAARRKVAGGP